MLLYSLQAPPSPVRRSALSDSQILPSSFASALSSSLVRLFLILSSLAAYSASKSLGTLSGSWSSNSFKPVNSFPSGVVAVADDDTEESRNDLRIEPKNPPTLDASPAAAEEADGEGVLGAAAPEAAEVVDGVGG